ncbi:rhamnogalacturonan acetylesterase [Caulobacter sp.]|uniref:rhamnogalacturonan acetylesterase n=1 Tax=Caulobacter sp. TaxID=78 RepID=UPI003BA8C4EA
MGLTLGPVVGAFAAGTPRWAFDFRPGPPAEGHVSVAATRAYSTEAGFGFEPRPVGAEASPTFLFSVAVPEGDYRVTVDLGDAGAPGDVTIKAESRRLMVERGVTRKGEVVSRTFIVNVRHPAMTPPPANAPGAAGVQLNAREVGSYDWDDRLTLEFCGPAPRLARLKVEPVTVPTVFLAGDSTVTDQRYEPAAGWGQMLPRFFKPEVSIANHAESGETLKAFLVERRLDKLLSAMKPGDYLFIQFGHNDQKANWPQTYAEAATTYRDYLKVYIGEARRRGATPVLVTSMHRRKFDAAGKIVNTLGDYPDAVRAVARETGVTLIDLHAMSAAFYEALGPDQAWKAFNDGGKDATHHNNYGAYQLARCVAEAIRVSGLPLARSLAADVSPFDPARPTPPDAFVLPESLARSSVAPRGN